MTRPSPDRITSMADLRACIDEIDDALLDLLAERWRYTSRAPDLKPREGIAARAPSRVADVLSHVRGRAETRGVPPDMVEAMWRTMIETVIAMEERVIGKEGKDA